MAPKQTLSPTMRKILQQQRKSLTQNQKNASERRNKLARESLATRRRAVAVKQSAIDALIAKSAANARAVASTWGVTLPIRIASSWRSKRLVAWTDYERIVVELPALNFVRSGTTELTADVRQVLAHLKAATYHECGHIRFTMPFPTMFALYAPSVNLSLDGPSLHRWWNVMEDQRMERRVVSESPTIGSYLTVLIKDEFPMSAQLWAWIIGRSYLPEVLRSAARDEFVRNYGEAAAVEAERIVLTYCGATEYPVMCQMVQEMLALMTTIGVGTPNSASDTHHQPSRSDDPEAADGATPSGASSSDEDGDESDGESQDGSGQSDQQDGDSDDDGIGTAPGAGGDDVEDDSDGSAPGADSGAEDGSDGQQPMAGTGNGLSLREALTEALAQAQEALDNDASLTADVQQVQADTNRFAEGMLTRVVGRPSLDSALVSKAEDIAAEMERAFDIRTADCAPIWQARTSRGVIDPFAYRTREPGSRDFHRQFDDHGDIGRSVAVSVLLDTSGSMGGHEDDLSAAGYAIFKACRDSDIPCTVMTFNSSSAILYDAADQTVEPIALDASGGTAPNAALLACEDQRHDKLSHIVIVLTDGLWDSEGLDALRQVSMNADSFVIGFGMSSWYGEMFTKAGAREWRDIDDLWHLPDLVRSMIEDYLG